jgi:micrococcal nuclease
MMMRVTSISATLIVLCILAVRCGAQEPQTQGVEKPKTEKAPEASEKPQERVQKDTEPQGAQKPQGTQKPRQTPQKDHQRERRPGGVLVVSVVDGDTFDISPAIQGMSRVRMIGVDTPEVYGGTEPCGPEASEYTTRHLEGRRVTLGVGEDPEDPYGRLLAWVWIDGQMINKMLVSEGLAEAVSYPPNTRYDPKLEHAEALAKKPSCADSSTSASASQTASATASPSASPSEGSGGGDSRLHNGGDDRLHNGVDDVNCSDLSGPVTVDAADEDNLDADGDGTGCE